MSALSVARMFRRPGHLLAAAAAISSSALLMLLPPPWPQLGSFLLIIVWPTLTWARSQSGNMSERYLVGGALALLLNVVLVLLLSLLEGVVPRGWQIALHSAIIVMPLLVFGEAPTKGEARQVWWPVLLVILVAVSMRLPALGYSEFQGDEGVVMVRAAAVIGGDEGELYLHQKGPAEILLPLGIWNVAGSINEFWARLPFLWANGLATLAVICLTRRWFGSAEAFAAGIFFSLAGFTVAFGRIVQYQSLVMLWGTAALFAATRYQKEGRRSDLLMSALFLSGGLLAHYDAVLVAPAIGWMLLGRVRRTKELDLRTWAAAAVSAAALLGIFYIPFILDPNFTRTGGYLLEGRLGASESSGLLSWSGPALWRMLTFYSDSYFVGVLILLISVALLMSNRRRLPLGPVLHFFVPLLFYLVVVKDPRTHVYTIMLGGSVLASAGAIQMGKAIKRMGRPRIYAGSVILFLFILVLSVRYQFQLFIDHVPERQRTWSVNRPSGYLTTWEEPPQYGLFGFPHQAGWRTVNALLPEGGVPYASNEEEEITNWYMLQAPRTHCPNLRTFILAHDAQDEIPYAELLDQTGYLQHQLSVNGRVTMEIFGIDQVEQVNRTTADDTTLWVSPADVLPLTTGGAYPNGTVLGDELVRLVGYDLDVPAARPGQEIVVTLYWEALAPLDRNYQAFVHVVEDELLSQHDGAPECDINPTTRWEPGQLIPDPHIVPIPVDVESSQLSLYAGMYDLVTLEPLDPPNANAHRIHLMDVPVEEVNQ